MTDSQGASSQAGQQAQGSGSQGSQGSQQGAQQSLSEQVLGKQETQTGSENLLPGQKPGESINDYSARLTTELERARKDAGRYRTELRQYTGDDAKDEQGLTEFQRLSKTVETLQSQLANEQSARKAEKATSSIIAALADAGAINPTRAMRLIDTSTELELGQDGTPTPESVAGAIAKLKADMPTVFADIRGSGDGGAGNQGAGDPQDFNALIRRRAGVA